MIPGAFAYHRPKSVQEAVTLLGKLGEDARPLAGGHSLIPMMKLRLAMPSDLIDLAGIPDLGDIREDGSEIVIGAMATQHDVIASELLAGKVPILKEAALLIADPQVRYVGTIGGNAANGDPGNDMPAVLLALGAIYDLTGPGGTRAVAARDYYLGIYDTALEPGEILTAIRIPTPASGHGFAYEKLKRKVGDYATAAAAVVLTLSGGTVASCAIGLTNVAERPLFAKDAAAMVTGTALDDDAVKKAVAAAEAITAPASDRRGTPHYRTKVAGVMVARALARAKERAAV